MDEVAARVSKKFNIKVNTVIEKGSISGKILKEAAEIDAKLIIMGTNGAAKGLKRRFIGSNALKVVKAAECPVITIKGKKMRQGCETIVLPIDLSKESREKVTNAIELAKLYGAAIRVVSILHSLDADAKTKLTRASRPGEEVHTVGRYCVHYRFGECG